MEAKEQKIGEALILMFETFGKEPKPQVIAVYVNMLSVYELREIRIAIAKAVESCSFCPVPATTFCQRGALTYTNHDVFWSAWTHHQYSRQLCPYFWSPQFSSNGGRGGGLRLGTGTVAAGDNHCAICLA